MTKKLRPRDNPWWTYTDYDDSDDERQVQLKLHELVREPKISDLELLPTC